jgi:aldose 1-epimerase
VKVVNSIIENKFLRINTVNYGASLYEVYHKRKKINLILNLGSKNNYKFKNASVGATCGRYAGRISNSTFNIFDKKLILSKNDGKNTLHGGKKGFAILPWKKIKKTKNIISYQLISKDSDQGFPGNLIINCTYQLKNNFLIIKYDYKSDKATHVNLTNHSYWNLEKNNKNKIFDHEVRINSKKYLEINNNLIPTGKYKNIKNTIYDFSKFTKIRQRLNFLINRKVHQKMKGFDTTYVVQKNLKNYVASLKNSKTKIKIDFFSNLPGLQLYSAQNLNYKKKLLPYQGICLETQYFPDTPNKKNFPSTLIKPNKNYKCFTKIVIN